MRRLWLIITALVVLGGPLRQPLESSMAAHMLIQLPLLALLGALVEFPRRGAHVLEQWDHRGVAVLLGAVFTVMFWMLPRNLDAAINSLGMEAAKFASLTVLVGMGLRWSWPRLPTLVRGVVWSQLVAMTMVMGWLFLTAPVRVCVNYGMDQQQLAGYGFVALGLGLAALLTARLFVDEAVPVSTAVSREEVLDQQRGHCASSRRQP
jgi:hypothetical protein